ncbi:hypothetical protein SRABI128_06265 [Microbacterium sp. Bi128]|nr:hypothetical protein SRABI128_06265 [Microbacterium sp. Bi128]
MRGSTSSASTRLSTTPAATPSSKRDSPAAARRRAPIRSVPPISFSTYPRAPARTAPRRACSSSKLVRMMQFRDGSTDLTSRQTSMPVPSGRRASNTQTSGCSAGIRRVASTADPELPTTANPSPSRSSCSPRLTSSWSSRIKTRITACPPSGAVRPASAQAIMILPSGRSRDRSILLVTPCSLSRDAVLHLLTPASAILVHRGGADKGHSAQQAASGQLPGALSGGPPAGLRACPLALGVMPAEGNHGSVAIWRGKLGRYEGKGLR